MIVRSGTGELIVATRPVGPVGVANRIIMIDPMTGLITKSIATPGEPWKLAVSDDGTTAYAISSTRTSAYRVNLVTGNFVKTISFSIPNDSVAANDIEVLAGATDSIVIAASWHGVRIYDNGVLRSQVSGYYSGSVIALLPDPKFVFGMENSSTYKYEITASGIKPVTEGRDLIPGYALESDGYHVYGEYGRVVRGDLMSIAGTFDLVNAFPQGVSHSYAVEPDRALRRVYFANDKQIASFDSDTYLRLRNVAFTLPGKFVSLERWGIDGFAARLDNGELAIIRSDLVPEMPTGIDLTVSITNDVVVTSPSLVISGQAFHGQGIAGVKVGNQAGASSSGFTNWVAQVDALVEGENTITITATSLGAPAETRSLTRRVVYRPAVVALIAQQWLVQHFGAIDVPAAAPNSDPDGDGQSNLSEFLFGTNPKTADEPAFTISQTAEGAFSLQMMRRNDSAFDFVIEGSRDFSAWQALPTPAQNNPPVSGAGSDYSAVTYNVTPDFEARFFRVRAVLK